MQPWRSDRPIYKIRERHYGAAEFPLKLKPQEDELLSSWLIRLALEHKTAPATFTNLYLPETKNKLWAGDVDLHADDDLLARLSEKAALSAELLREMTFRSYEGVLFEKLYPDSGGTPFLLKTAMRGRWSRAPGVRWCPECLAEEERPCFRKEWRLALFTVCLKHRKCLVDRCICGRPLTMYKALWLDGKPCCPICRRRLHNADGEGQSVSIGVFQAQEMIQQILDDGYALIDGKPVYSHQYFRVLHHMLRMLISRKWGPRLWVEVGLEGDFGSQKVFEGVAIQGQAQLIEKAVWLLGEWPERIVGICRRQRILSSVLLHDLEAAPFWYWDVVMRELYRPDILVAEEEIKAAIAYMGSHGMPVNQQRLSRLLGVHQVFRKRSRGSHMMKSFAPDSLRQASD